MHNLVLVGFLCAPSRQQHSSVSQALEGKMLSLVFLTAVFMMKFSMIELKDPTYCAG